MTNKQIYQLLPDGTWDGRETYAKPDPYDVGNWLIPGRCVETPPPAVTEGFAAVWENSEWKTKIDKRGTVFWFDYSTSGIITAIGVDVPEEAHLVRPEQPIEKVKSISMRQCRLTLLANGLLSTVDTLINQLPEPAKSAAKIAWEFSSEVERSNGLVPGLASAMGLTESEIDQLFLEASKL